MSQKWADRAGEGYSKLGGSDGLVLDGFLGVDDSFLVEDAVCTESALDCVVGFQL